MPIPVESYGADDRGSHDRAVAARLSSGSLARFLLTDTRETGLGREVGDSQGFVDAEVSPAFEQSEQREELRRALATLPELDRYLIYQRYFKFASTEELAAQTGLTRHAVDTRLWRARKSLREALKEHAHEYERL